MSVKLIRNDEHMRLTKYILIHSILVSGTAYARANPQCEQSVGDKCTGTWTATITCSSGGTASCESCKDGKIVNNSGSCNPRPSAELFDEVSVIGDIGITESGSGSAADGFPGE